MATVRLQLRRGLADDWFDANPTLAAGEIGIETDTNTFKFGDGNTPWNSLEYALSGTVDDYIPLSTKAQAGGVASLDNSGFVPVSQLPPLAKVTVSAVANSAARLALTAEAGDIAIQADNGQSYVLSASPASTDSNWKALVGSEAVVDTVETALVAGTGLDKTYDDAAGTITIDIDSTVATKTYADQAEADAVSTASADATSKANAAQAAAEATASADATSKANAAKTAAELTAANALSAHESDTTGVHGIADTSLLATLSNVATAKSEAQGYTDTQISLVLNAAPAALNTLDELAAALGDDANFAGTVTTSLAAKAPLDSPTFTGTVGLPQSTSIGNVSDVEIGYLNGVTSAVQTQLDAKAPLDGPTFTGTVSLPESTSIGNVSNVELSYLDGVTSSVQGQIDDKLASATAASTYAPLASPTLTGTVTLPSSTSIGDVSNVEIGYLNGVTSAVQTQLDAKAPLASPTFTGTVTLPANTITQSMMSDDSVGTNEIGGFAVTADKLAVDSVTETKIADGSVTSAKIANGTIVNADINDSAAIAQSKIDGLGAALDLKAPLANPTFTGTVAGVTKAHVGLGNVDNTTDANKPVSTATQTALDLKAPLDSPTFTTQVRVPSSVEGPNSSTSVNLFFGSGTANLTLGGGQTSGNLTLGGGSGRTTGVIGIGTGATTTGTKTINIGTGSTGGTTAITVGSSSGATSNITLNGAVTAANNLVVEGDLTVNGTNFTASATSITIEDNLVQLAHQNSANTVDLGLVVGYNDGAAKHSGIVRDVSEDKWKLFKGVTTEPSTTVDFTQGSLDSLQVAGFEATSATIGDVSNTELQYLNGVTSAVQTQLDAKAPTANPTFTGTVTVGASGIAFTDGSQTKQGVPSLTTIGTEISADYNLSTGGLALRDQLIPIAGTRAITVPTNTTTAFPVGTSISFYQASGTGANFVAADGTVTILRTPGLKLRTTHSSATITKVATNTWLLAGDLTA